MESEKERHRCGSRAGLVEGNRGVRLFSSVSTVGTFLFLVVVQYTHSPNGNKRYIQVDSSYLLEFSKKSLAGLQSLK